MSISAGLDEIMEKRTAERNSPKIVHEDNVTYQTVHEKPVITGQGSLLDISENGCRIGGKHGLRKGLQIQLAVADDAGKPSTILTKCQVAWVKDGEFGVQFLW